MADQPEPFSTEERAALEAWTARKPPAGFADSVLARLDEAEVRPTSTTEKRRWPLVAAAAVAALGLWGLVARWPEQGTVSTTERTTVHLGRRGVAVAEVGSRLEWATQLDAAAVVTQTSGDVFYRVEPGGAFDVKTPAGTVHVTGTCFRVEVNEMNPGTIKGAAVGAVLGAIAVVTVYEGAVVASSGGGMDVPVKVGQVATLDGRSVAVAATPAPSLPRAGATNEGPLARAQGSAASVLVDGGSELAQELPHDVAALQAKVAQLEAELRIKKDEDRRGPRNNKTYDLSSGELMAMAERCELRWDLPRIDEQRRETVSPDDAKALQLTERQQAQIDELLNRFNTSAAQQIREMYVELTRDPNAGSMGIDSMVSEILDKTPKLEQQRAYQTLARERAGLQSPPTDLSKTSVFERLHRLLQGAGDALVTQLGEAVNPDVARRLRDLHQGFGSQHISSYGCPPASP